ncbi:hypothetical protein [Vibrio aestuarianus]|uniref:Uncharacterized protein n=1 Tax=Vibrio aestuarianus TaxID=28171 RepID=A0A9X4FHU4_9VIBR|nr:hypothetical protein [Vibrio aestuarianus]MDE1348402.1 hypothetical protein [Vibrio aestuarianus]
MKKDKYPYSLLIVRLMDMLPYAFLLVFLGVYCLGYPSSLGQIGVLMILVGIVGEWRQRFYLNDSIEDSIINGNLRATGLNHVAKTRVFLIKLNPLLGGLGTIFTGWSVFI